MDDLTFLNNLSLLYPQYQQKEGMAFLRGLKLFAKPLLQKATPMAGRMAYRNIAGHLGNMGGGALNAVGRLPGNMQRLGGGMLRGLSEAPFLKNLPGMKSLGQRGVTMGANGAETIARGNKLTGMGDNLAWRAAQNLGKAEVHGANLARDGRHLSKWMGQYGIPGMAGYMAMDYPMNMMGVYGPPDGAKEAPPAATPGAPPQASPGASTPGAMDEDTVGMVTGAYQNLPFFKRMAVAANPGFIQPYVDQMNAKVQTANTMANNFKQMPFFQRLSMGFNPSDMASKLTGSNAPTAQ